MALSKQHIPTPALLLDLDLFEINLKRMQAEATRAGKRLRPHAKAHKCVEIAKRQIAAGAQGLCVATVAEAELMANAGIEDLLLTSPLADPLKIARMVVTNAMAVVDHARQADWYQEAAQAANKTIPILIDLDPGDHRTGAASLEQAIDIALSIDRASHLWLRGVQAYSVSGAHGKEDEERHKLSAETYAFASEVRGALAARGLHTDVLTGGSTGTWNVDLTIPEVTELQAGTYALMDIQYRSFGIDFEQALTVLATVISANHPDFVTVDAGFKAFSTDRTFGPEPANLPGATYRYGGDEFGYLTARRKLGEKIEFLPPHCDPTVNLYDRIYACRGQNVESIWPIMGRL